MLLTFQDRLRIPWRGGAKQITLDSVITLVALIATLMMTAISFQFCLFIFSFIPMILMYMKRFCGLIHSKTKFFIVWFFGSCVYLLALFELTVPLLEILPQENISLVVLMTLGFLCLFKAKQRAAIGDLAGLPDVNGGQLENCKGPKDTQVVMFSDRDDSDEGSTDTEIGRLACQLCRKYVPPRTYHCKVCSVCMVRQDHHNVWLNCCIGKSNHRLYLAGCLFTLMALVVFANLSMTAVCRPTPVFTLYGVIVMMPDDCNDIFFQYDIALCFTGSLYALMMATFLTIAILKQICFISFGFSFDEWRRGDHVKRRNCFWNWKAFCLGQ
ncbi:palmitoyltransferase ZDHHC23-B [Anopheles funestus]|uniref:Palmitoyltransferase n=1 Tax=Anopheles funestus TaxID=62324 RepID=A0A182R2Z9_ANOFN|nr:palmitoyltransferase ZDHHC23-B [Anopheles funestus]